MKKFVESEAGTPMSMGESGDLWTSRDKVYHVIFCFSLTLLLYLLISRSPFSYVRRRSLLLASPVSLLAGAAKEAADHLGFFRSSGASAKDCVADVLGVLIACLVVPVFKAMIRKSKVEYPEPEIALV